MERELTHAKRKIVGIYLCIIGIVVSLFSLLVIYAARDSFLDTEVPSRENTVLSADEALERAFAEHPELHIVESQYEIEDEVLYYAVAYDDGSELKFDLLTGNSVEPLEGGIRGMLTNDFDGTVWWIAFFVFMLSALLAAYVAQVTLRPIARNMEAQRQFVSDAAHELRNPLAALQARIESTLRTGNGEVDREVLSDLLSETKRLIETSESLLSLERGAFRTRIPKELPVDIHLSATLTRLDHFSREKNITVSRSIEGGSVIMDSEDLDTLLYNVLHNAFKFTKEGGTVSVSWKDHILTIADTGIGVPRAERERIFDRFYKSDTARSEGGSGLGLTLVHEIALRYGIKIALEDTKGGGATFIFTWPT